MRKKITIILPEESDLNNHTKSEQQGATISQGITSHVTCDETNDPDPNVTNPSRFENLDSTSHVTSQVTPLVEPLAKSHAVNKSTCVNQIENQDGNSKDTKSLQIGIDENLSFSFDDKIISNLPDKLREPFSDGIISKKQQIDLSTVVLIGILSGMLPNYYMVYDGARVSPNLFLAIVATFGAGKGYIKFLKRILKKTHKRKLAQAKADLERYLRELQEAASGDSDKTKHDVDKPKLFRLIIPANNSKTGAIELLDHNGGKGVIIEFEIDTLVDAIKQDYGQFSDVLRNAFQNEGYSLHRRTNNESIEIDSLFLTVILSGTLGQLFTLVPKIENGLFSRFMYFFLTEDSDFHDVFDDSKLKLEKYFDDYAVFFDEVHLQLEQREEPLLFSFQKHQRVIFQSFFQNLKTELQDNVDSAFGGVVHRLALMCARIAQILAFYRQVTDTQIPDKIICQDVDFHNALDIISVLKNHTLKVFFEMPEPQIPSQSSRDEQQSLNIAKAIELQKEGLSYREIAKALFGDEGKRQKVWRWIKKFK